MNNSLRRIWIVFTKEVLDNLRDRRSLITSLISTMITPALLIGMIVVLGKTIFSEPGVNESFIVPVQGASHAPGLISFLEQNRVEVVDAPSDPHEAVRQGQYEVILIIPEGYEENFTSSRPANVQVIADTTNNSALLDIDRLDNLIMQYSTTIGALRLYARGINPTILQAVQIEMVDVATPQGQAMIFLNMLPFMLVIIIFTGGSYVIIDTTAGERERNSLEPLLINPAQRWELVAGKYLAALPFVTATLALTLAAFGIGLTLVPLEEYLGRPVEINFGTLWNIFLLCLPMICFASAIQVIIASFTRSFKEAQTYTSLIGFVPALPGVFMSFLPSQAEFWKMLVPTYGQQFLINEWMGGGTVDPIFPWLASAVTLLATVLLLVVAVRLYNREKLLFGAK
jgi:sodium transport system permease protein